MVDLPLAGAPAMAMTRRPPSGTLRSSDSTWVMKASVANSVGIDRWYRPRQVTGGSLRLAPAASHLARVTATLRWAVVLVDLDPTVEHEQAGHRRALVVSYEPFHRSGMCVVCPISVRAPRHPGEVPIPAGHAGQTRDAVILCHQVRTIDQRRITTFQIGGQAQYVSEPAIRRPVRIALARQLGLDIPSAEDGAA